MPIWVATYLLFLLCDQIVSKRFTVSVDQKTNVPFLVNLEHKKARPILDNVTLDEFRTRFGIENMDLSSENYTFGPPVESLVARSYDADETMRINVIKLMAIQDNDNLLREMKKVSDCINPTITFVQNKCLYFCPARAALSSMYFMDSTCTSLVTKIEVDTTLQFDEDERLLVQNGSIWVVHTNLKLGVPNIALAQLEVTSNMTARFSNATLLSQKQGDGSFKGGLGSFQKNWVPFIYDDSINFVESHSPMHVVKMEHPVDFGDFENYKSTLVTTVSTTHEDKLQWNFGGIRGGTPAHLINSKEYLTFFHSMSHLPGNPKSTYVMGALTFSSSPPFRVVRISQVPLVNKQLYEGPWSRNRFKDYIVFPMGYVFMHNSTEVHTDIAALKDHHNVDVLLSFGYQDYQGWTVKIDLDELIKSMVTVVE